MSSPNPTPTAREIEVAPVIAQGRSNKQTGLDLDVYIGALSHSRVIRD
jgi:DNA-binding NarL/FixJ family response regulator